MKKEQKIQDQPLRETAVMRSVDSITEIDELRALCHIADKEIRELYSREADLIQNIQKIESEKEQLISHLDWIKEVFADHVNEDYGHLKLSEWISDFLSEHGFSDKVSTTGA